MINRMLLVQLVVMFALSSELHAASLNPAPWTGVDINGQSCTGRTPGSGPYDYLERNEYRGELVRVERRHFTAKVEQLKGGESTSDPLSDLEYTIIQWPNHHRALYAVIRHQLNRDQLSVSSSYPPAECYLQRALLFTPKDGRVYKLYGYFLKKLKKFKMAAGVYQRALRHISSDPELHYLLGLVYLEMKEYSLAVEQAKKAESKGVKKKKLKNKLVKLDKWPS